MFVFDGVRSACKKDLEGQYHIGEMQCFDAGGEVSWHQDGSPAVIKSKYGDGKTLLIGTLLGKCYYRNRGENERNFPKS